MASYYGKAYNFLDGQQINKESDAGKTAYKALMQGDNIGFSALLGGYRHSGGAFFDLGYIGYYWNSTERDAFRAWHYGFLSKNKILHRYGGSNKRWARSCRCLQN